ncbi:hypothetical protein J6590_039761 [Homalodisca vitripennis]|nr:hypothetical protein J6590_039761 [Homalodisca vitripennis]
MVGRDVVLVYMNLDGPRPRVLKYTCCGFLLARLISHHPYQLLILQVAVKYSQEVDRNTA